MSHFFALPLSRKPSVVKCGFSEHGLHGREEYLLPRLWCLHLYFYKVQIHVGGRTHSILPGSLTLIPPNTPIAYDYTAKRHRHFFVHFTAHGSTQSAVTVPVCQHLPSAMDELQDRLQNIQRIRAKNPFHADISFWSLLWDVVESGATGDPVESRSLAIAKQVDALLDATLPGKISARKIARELGLSMAHVNRILKAAHGLTTVQIMRKRRAQRAYHLLLHSTMPIKLVAAECGLSNLQQFNKAIRLEYGKSPRALRENQAPHAVWAQGRK